MEISNFKGYTNSSLYSGFYEDVRRYFEYLRIIHSNKIKDILVGTNEFRFAEITDINGGSFSFKMEVPRIKSFDEVIEN